MAGPNLNPRPYVYRVWNAEGVLLYIGSTICLEQRMKSHAANTRWWHVAKRFEFTRYDTEQEAREAELIAIATEFPRWNVRGRAPFHPDGRAANYIDILARFPGDCRWRMGEAGFIKHRRAALAGRPAA